MRTIELRLVFLLFIPFLGNAQITPRNLIQKAIGPEQLKQFLLKQEDFHPFPNTPGQWRQILPDSMIRVLIKSGEDALKGDFQPIPAITTLDFVRNGDRIRYENILFAKRNRVWDLMLAESIEGKKRFIDAIIDGLWSIAEESFWGTSAHLFIQKAGPGLPDVEEPVIDLFAAETAATMAGVDYFVGAQLDSVSPQLRRRIYYEVNRRIFIPMKTANYEWMGFGDKNAKLNNWAPWIISNYLTAVLFLEKDPATRLQYVEKAIAITDQYINGFGDDGGCEEGPHYWTFGSGCVFGILNLLGSATNGKLDIYNEPIIRNMGAYIYRAHISDNYFVDVADSRPELTPEAAMTWRYGNMVNDTILKSFGAWLYKRGLNNINATFHRSRFLYDLLYVKDIVQDNSRYIPVKDVWLPDVQLMTTRLPNGFFVAAHGGHNGESHNHNDVGDFIIYSDGVPVIVDVGAGTYTSKTFSKERYNIWFNNSAHHNLPTINGQQQLEGSLYRGKDVSYKKEKDIVTFKVDIAGAYPGGILDKWKRTIEANANSVMISDDWSAKQPLYSLTQTFMTVCDVNIESPGSVVFTTAKGRKVILQYGKEWTVSKEIMQLLTPEEQGLKVTWRNLPITRVLLTSLNKLSKGNFRYKIVSDVKSNNR